MTNFYFSSASLTPGTVYYLEPVALSGDLLRVDVYHYGYDGGTGFANGIAFAGGDLWFREGIIVPAPEPETLSLGLLGAGVLLGLHRRRQRVGA